MSKKTKEKEKEKEPKEETPVVYESKCEECPRYSTCSAPLCPLDEHLEDRIWRVDAGKDEDYVDEDEICLSQKYNKDARWIKKQRSIIKRKTNSWYGKATTYQDLVNASRPPKISEEMMQQRRERMKSLQDARKAKKDKLEEIK